MAVDAQGQEEARKRREVGAWSSPKQASLLQRIRPTMGHATTDDLLEFARVELEDALDNVEPIEGGSEFHAGCCMMRAKAALETVRDRLREFGTRAEVAEAVANRRLTALADLLRVTSDDPDFDEVEARALALIKQADEEDAVGGMRLSEPARMAIAKLDE